MKNKILAISIILILLSSIFITSNVFATETIDLTCCYDVIPLHENGDQYVPYFIYKSSIGNIFLMFTNSTSATRIYLSNDDYIYADTGHINWYKYDSNNKCFIAQHIGKFSGTIHVNVDTSTFLASNIDIYRNNSLFFQQTPVPIPQITLAQELEKIQVTQVWTTLMKNVVVSLVVFLVGLIAFSKAWGWLKTQLHKA